MFGSAEEHDFRFHQVHPEDGGRIRYKRVCEVCGNEIEYRDIAKGYELEDGRVVVLTDEDFAKLPVFTDKSIQVLEFVPAEEVDPIYFQKTYYLEPDKTANRPYVLLRQALEDTDRLAVVKITMRQRESLAILRARDDVLVLHTIYWPDEIRKPDFGFLEQDLEVRPQELKMATSLIDNMAGSFKPEQFTDEYRDAMADLIAAKAEGADLPERPETEEQGDVIDLMTALERSVEQTRAKSEPAAAGAKKKTTSKSKSSKRTA
jgi:DNA end-binding protein Ku